MNLDLDYNNCNKMYNSIIDEKKLLIDNGFISTSFGNRVLRTETASLYALSIINYILMR